MSLNSGTAEPRPGTPDLRRDLPRSCGSPFIVWQTTVLHAMQATLEGRFAEGEQLVQEAFALGQRAQTPNAFLLCSVQLFALRREQGRFQELEEAFKMLVERYPAIPALRPALSVSVQRAWARSRGAGRV